MAVKPVLLMGEPCLLLKAESVTQFDSPELQTLIHDLEDTMRFMNGAGIAAPQIGVSLRVVIFGQKTTHEGDESNNPRYPEADSVPYTVLINPEVTPVGESMA